MLKIINKLKKNKIPLDEYIDLCLYRFKESYYEKKFIFGPRGDFITSPYISSIFGEIIAIYILNYFLEKKITKFSILEIGAGEGLMSKDIIHTLLKFKNIKFNYSILEKSKNLKKVQKKKLEKYKINWLNSLKNSKDENLFILSNELLDSFPVKHLKKIKNQWLEKYVFYNEKKDKIDTEYKKLKKNNNKIISLTKKNIDFIEYSPGVLELLNHISRLIKKHKNNCFLTLDYGYSSEKFENTLQGLKKHTKVNIFNDPGNTDITYLINFNLIKKIFDKNCLFNNINMSQSEFLISSGIVERLNQAKKYLISKDQKQKLEMAVSRLIDRNQMGELFKVFLVTNDREIKKIK